MQILQQFQDLFEYIPKAELYTMDGYVIDEYEYMFFSDTIENIVNQGLSDKLLENFGSVQRVAQHLLSDDGIREFTKGVTEKMRTSMNEDDYDFITHR